METTRDVKWALWVFAGPGALAETPGQPIPLAERVGELPVGVALLAETVGTPTLLQQLTDEWPTELILGLDGETQPKAMRSLSCFLEWSDATTTAATTPPSSPSAPKRALIILGDMLQAIGEEPKDLVSGDYRPPYPARIQITKAGASTSTPYTAAPGSRSRTTLYGTKTIGTWVQSINPGDAIRFDDGPSYTCFYKDQSDKYFFVATEASSNDRYYYTVDTSNNAEYSMTSQGVCLNYPGTFYIKQWQTGTTYDPPVAYSTSASSPTQTSDYASGGSSPSTKSLQDWVSDQLGDQDAISFDGSVYYVYDTSSAVFTKSTTPADSTNYQITLKSLIMIHPLPVTTTVSATPRSIDDAGPADVDPPTRRIDALADALEKHQIDLLASDDRDLLRLAALRRLAPRTKVLIGARQSLERSGQPLMALLEALRSQNALEPEQLAARAIEKAGPDAGLVALRSAGAEPLLAALDEFASQAVAGSPARRCFEDVWTGSSCADLAQLTASLETIDSNLATKIDERAAATIIAPSPTAKSSGFGIDLDGHGLQLGPASAWTNLLDAVGNHADAAMARRTLEDMQTLTAMARQAHRLAPIRPEQAGRVLEYPDQERNTDVEPARDLARFLKKQEQQNQQEQDERECLDARHVVLVIRGKWERTHPGSVTFDDGTSLPLAALTQCLHDALSRRRRGPLALLVFEDPKLLRVENAYELREVAYTLMTPVAGAELPGREWFEQRVDELVGNCEQLAADELERTETGPVPPLVHKWRRDVAVGLAKLLAAPEPTETHAITLQGIDLRHLGALCRLLGRLCHRMYDHLDDALVLGAMDAGKEAPNLLEWIRQIQMDGFYPQLEATKWNDRVAARLYNDWGELYNWLSSSEAARQEAGVPLWIPPGIQTGRDPSSGERLLVSLEEKLPRDYRSLSFHQDVSLQALLTAARLLLPDRDVLRPYWGLISMGLAYGPSSQRHEQLGRLIDEPEAAHYFWPLGAPPLISLAIEQSQDGYDLHLESSESQATLVHQRCFASLDHVDESLEGLAYVMSGSMASGVGFEYLEGLGASLAEDILGGLRELLEPQRELLLRTGRCREAHLALELPRELMRYPWELMQIPVQAERRSLEMLAERFAVGRQLWTERDLPHVERDQDEIRVLVVADPITDRGCELPAARREGQDIENLCAKMTNELQGVVQFECDVSIHQVLTRSVLRQCLRRGNYDVLHFAGHGTFANTLDQSGWLLSDGWLTGTELSSTLSSCASPPWLIYANACSGGMIGGPAPRRYQGDVHGMAEACIGAGVGAYVAPLWRIQDDSARLLAQMFYRLLLLEGRTIGVALQHARMRVRRIWETRRGDAGLGDISWAGMVLFGNPGARLREYVG